MMSKSQTGMSSLAQRMGGSSHATVIGGSIAGLLAARVLADHFDKVTVVERDLFPEKPAPRQGVPQSYQLHVLLTQGLRILEQLFPGFKNELTDRGALTVDWTFPARYLGASLSGRWESKMMVLRNPVS